MNTTKFYIVSLAMSLATGTAAYLLSASSGKKIGVVDAVRLVDHYNMKKELEAKAKVRLDAAGKQVDSVEQQLNLVRAAKNEDETKKLAYVYNYLRNQLEEAYRQSNQEISVQVWKRLNPGLNEYGKSRQLHLIIGANGMGTVLYNDDYYDLTEDAIKYINKRYEEGN